MNYETLPPYDQIKEIKINMDTDLAVMITGNRENGYKLYLWGLYVGHLRSFEKVIETIRKYVYFEEFIESI